jgi:hypothetical protein
MSVRRAAPPGDEEDAHDLAGGDERDEHSQVDRSQRFHQLRAWCVARERCEVVAHDGHARLEDGCRETLSRYADVRDVSTAERVEIGDAETFEELDDRVGPAARVEQRDRGVVGAGDLA